MESDVKEYLKWLGIVALIIVIANLIGCTRVVYQTPFVLLPDTVFAPCDGAGPCTLAEMVCSEENRPVVLVRKSTFTDTGFVFTKAHEKKHIEQMQSDCKKVAQAYLDSIPVQIRMESEAYCAEGKERLKAYKDVALVSSWFAGMMQALFDLQNVTCVLKPP